MTSDPEVAAQVTVRPMTAEEYATWHERSVASYAEDVARATGAQREVALRRARSQFVELLPQGPDSDRTWLLRVLDATGTDVGRLWIGPHPERPDVAFLFDIETDEARRGRGLGRAAMLAAEDVVRRAGLSELGLNVFGFNEPARRLYDSLGYRVVATQMTKTLRAVP